LSKLLIGIYHDKNISQGTEELSTDPKENHVDNKSRLNQLISFFTQRPKNKIGWILFSFFWFLTPMTTEIYSATYKMKGLNSSLNDKNLPSIPKEMFIVLLLMNIVVFYFYVTKPSKEKLEKEPNATLFQDEEKQSSLEKNTTTSEQKSWLYFSYVLVLAHAVVYIWTTYAVSSDIFTHTQATHNAFIAQPFALACTLGAFTVIITFVAPKVIKYLPQIFKREKYKGKGTQAFLFLSEP
jgi:hypothetical protein